jgi:enolase-phosphatase E1
MGDSARHGVVLDIEGTTTPIAFVTGTLFPYARERLLPFLRANAGEPRIDEILAQLESERRREASTDDPPPVLQTSSAPRADSAAAYAEWLMERDRKSTALKALQGMIWAEGYRSGSLRGEVFPDVPPALQEWRRSGVDVRIFSSGSVLAQQLLFRHSRFGDLTPSLSGYFDTTTGAKTDASSYGRIVEVMALEPAAVLFVSDVVAELDAARQAGLRTALTIRPGNRPAPPGHPHRAVSSLADIRSGS